MSGNHPHDHSSAEERRKRAGEWFSREGRDKLLRALGEADEESRKFREAATLDPSVLEQPMTV